MSVDFLTPIAGLVAAVCVIPAAALLHARAVARRRRRDLGLAEPPRRAYLVPGAALAVAAACLGLAATQPVVTLDESHRVRTDAEAFVAIDISRSMLASRTPETAARIERAKSAAEAVAEALPSVPVGIATFTDRTLPHLFPTPDLDAVRATLDKAIGIERPPPVHTLLTRVTSLESLSAVATQGFYAPTATRRVLVVLTDGESLPGSRARLAPLFARPPGIATVFVHLWDREERVFRGRVPEAGYRPDPGSREILDRLAADLGGRVFAETELGLATEHLPKLVGTGPTVVEGQVRRDVPLAPLLAGVVALPLALLLWRRDR